MDKEVPFKTEEGYEYLVVFQEYSNYSSIFGIKIIDVSIILLNDQIEQNTYKSLIEFVKIINLYLEENQDIILYYYCDTSPIKIRANRKQKLSYQEFRSKIFISLFKKFNSNNYIIQEIVVEDEESENHYASLISLQSNSKKIEKITVELEMLLRK